jgi:hypothetical protein
MGPATTSRERWYSRKDAAALCGSGASVDTLKRAAKAGKLPNSRRRPGCPNDTVEIALTDLIDAGFYTPSVSDDEPDARIRRVRDERRIEELTAELHRARATAEAVQEHNTFLKAEIRQLHKLVEQVTRALGGER